MNRTLKVRDFINLLNKRKKIILLVTFYVTFIGGFTSFAIPPKFEAKTEVVVNFTTEHIVSIKDREANLHLIDNYNYLMKNIHIVNKVNSLLNETYEKDELYGKVKIESKLDSQILTILVEEKSPEKAMALANTMAKIFKDETKSIVNLKNVYILSNATLVEDSNAPIPVLFFLISAVIGFLLSYILLLVQEIFSTIIDSSQKAEKVLGIPIIGEFPFDEISHNEVLAERFNSIRNDLLNMLSKQNSKTLLITSAESGDGKSFISTNLSIAFATDLKNTVYVNANLREETGHNLFQLPNHLGVTSYVTGLSKLQDIIQDTEVPNLSFISAGPISSNPPVLLSSTKFSQLMNELKNLFDIIIVDSPPLKVVDTLLISTHVDTCLYVVNAESSKLEQTIYSIERLKKVQAPLIRLILNKTNT